MKRLLVLTNGAGEDAIAARILARLPEQARRAVVCFPLVGAGRALEAAYELIGPRVLPPSEGLFRESWRLAAADLLQGVLAGHLRQLKFLREHRAEFGLVVAVGDLFPVLLAGLAGLQPLVFVGTAKSVYHHPYSWPERWLLRRLACSCLVRDQATAERLSAQGVPARWLGNAMMDEVAPTGRPLPLKAEGHVVALLPGSRTEAPAVLPFQLQALERLDSLHAGPLQAAVAAAPGIDVDRLCAQCLENGWTLHSCPGEGALGLLQREGLSVPILQGRLGDLLAHSSVALGQAGTANEQAAGAGVPVVAYSSRALLRWYRKRQKGLLGDAVAIVPEDFEAVARELAALLDDPTERERRGQIGRERMGPPGGAERMAEAIRGLWSP